MTYLPIILLLLAIAGVLYYRRKKDGAGATVYPKNKYDEYQQLLRDRGYKYAFYSLIVTLYILYMVAELADIRFPQAFYFCFLMYVGISVQVGYSLWSGAYFPINGKEVGFSPKQFFVLSICVVVIVLVLIMQGDYPVDVFAKGGLGMICLLGLFPLQNIIILGIRLWRERRSADE